jgi:hypothetical protein
VRIPLILHLGAASQLVPLVAALLARRRPSPAAAWTLAWCATLVAVDASALAIGWSGHRNLFLPYLTAPLSTALVLWALSLWHRAELPRLTIRFTIIPFLVACGVLTFALENTSSFSSVVGPLASLVGLAAAAFTLVARSHRDAGRPLGRDWFWICGGMVLYFGAATMMHPLAALLLGGSRDLLVRAYEVKSTLDVAAFLLIARGVACRAET